MQIDMKQPILDKNDQLASELRARAKRELGLTLSVGVSYNKVFAKLGSDMKKPDATTVITPENFRQKVWPLPVEELLYVGAATKSSLNAIGIFTIQVDIFVESFRRITVT